MLAAGELGAAPRAWTVRSARSSACTVPPAPGAGADAQRPGAAGRRHAVRAQPESSGCTSEPSSDPVVSCPRAQCVAAPLSRGGGSAACRRDPVPRRTVVLVRSAPPSGDGRKRERGIDLFHAAAGFLPRARPRPDRLMLGPGRRGVVVQGTMDVVVAWLNRNRPGPCERHGFRPAGSGTRSLPSVTCRACSVWADMILMMRRRRAVGVRRLHRPGPRCGARTRGAPRRDASPLPAVSRWTPRTCARSSRPLRLGSSPLGSAFTGTPRTGRGRRTWPGSCAPRARGAHEEVPVDAGASRAPSSTPRRPAIEGASLGGSGPRPRGGIPAAWSTPARPGGASSTGSTCAAPSCCRLVAGSARPGRRRPGAGPARRGGMTGARRRRPYFQAEAALGVRRPLARRRAADDDDPEARR